jgi:hypothetical protein
MPPKVPVNQYWSATAYNRATYTLIRSVGCASRSSLTSELKSNADGSTKIWFGPKASGIKPIELDTHQSGEEFEVIFRSAATECPLLGCRGKADIEQSSLIVLGL